MLRPPRFGLQSMVLCVVIWWRGSAIRGYEETGICERVRYAVVLHGLTDGGCRSIVN